MQTQNGNQRGQQPPRGQQGRPDITAKPVVGEDKVRAIIKGYEAEILALFATEKEPAAAYKRAEALSVSAYRKMQRDVEEAAYSQNKKAPHINEEATVAACLWAIQRKLDPGTDVYLVPFGQKVTPILSPQGVIKLIMRSGYVRAVQPPRAVLDGESFDYQLGSEQWVKHKKANKRLPAKKDDRGQVVANPAAWEQITHVYVVIELKDDGQVIEVLDKADIIYYRSLSPTGHSSYSGWGKFPAEFARKAVLKQAAKWIPQDSEVSVLLASDESERGIEIPDEFMRAVGAKVVAEMLAEQGNGAGNGRKSDPGAAPPAGSTGNGDSAPPANEGSAAPQPGDPRSVFMPGKKGAPKVTVADAEDKDLAYWEGRGREDFESGKWQGDAFEQKNITQLVTIRAEMRRRGLEVTPHIVLDPRVPPMAPVRQNGQAQGPDPRGDGALSPEEEDAIFGNSDAEHEAG